MYDVYKAICSTNCQFSYLLVLPISLDLKFDFAFKKFLVDFKLDPFNSDDGFRFLFSLFLYLLSFMYLIKMNHNLIF